MTLRLRKPVQYQYSLDGLDSTLACVKVMNIAILTDADKEHYEKILFSRAVARKKFDWGNVYE